MRAKIEQIPKKYGPVAKQAMVTIRRRFAAILNTKYQSGINSPISDAEKSLMEHGYARIGIVYDHLGNLIDLNSYTKIEVPPDVVIESNGRFVGIVYCFQLAERSLKASHFLINTKLGSEPLPDFKYKKPIIGNDLFNPVSESWEEKDRKGYYPLLIVKDAFRGPHHWHRKDDALFCAVKQDGQWSTRYFPKHNIPDATWNEAVARLKKDFNIIF